MTNKCDERRVQPCLKTAREVYNVHCVHVDTKRKRRVVKLVSDVHCVQSGKMIDCCKILIDDTPAITFEEDNQTSTNDGNHVSYSSMRQSNSCQKQFNLI